MQEHQTISIKNLLFVISSLFFVLACQQKNEVNILNEKESLHVLESLLTLVPTEGLVYFKDELFTGFGVTFYNQQQFSGKTQYVKGLKEGKSKKWFKNGVLSFEANYRNGLLHGKVFSWWKNGVKRSESSYVNGTGNGIQMQWYASGSKFKKIQLVNGAEEGIQQSWRENGKIYNNYEAKNGRIYGLKRSKLCFNLDDEEIQLAF